MSSWKQCSSILYILISGVEVNSNLHSYVSMHHQKNMMVLYAFLTCEVFLFLIPFNNLIYNLKNDIVLFKNKFHIFIFLRFEKYFTYCHIIHPQVIILQAFLPLAGMSHNWVFCFRFLQLKNWNDLWYWKILYTTNNCISWHHLNHCSDFAAGFIRSMGLAILSHVLQMKK